MKVKINKRTEIIEEFEVELPHYYKYDFDREFPTMLYGKIEHNKHTSIQVNRLSGEIKYTFEVEDYNSIESKGFDSWFKPEYKSNSEEFGIELKNAKDFINGL